MSKMKGKISFKDLSTGLKTAVVLFWIGVGINVLAFLIGLIAGIGAY